MISAMTIIRSIIAARVQPTAIPMITDVVRPGRGCRGGSVVGGATRGSTLSVRPEGKESGLSCGGQVADSNDNYVYKSIQNVIIGIPVDDFLSGL